MPQIMAEYFDRLITVEMRNRGMPRGKIAPLYDAARAEGDERPLTLRAAQGLVDRVKPGDSVLIVTGAGTNPFMPKGEDDGPIGAAVLARAIYWGLGATPVFACEQHHVDPIVASSEAAGVTVRDYDIALKHRMGGAIMPAPTVQDAIPRWADDLLDRVRPSAIIAIERLGPNAQGHIHTSTGLTGGWSPLVDLAPLFRSAASRNILSIGIGDAGNEIGFGRIVDAVHKLQPYGESTGGMATVVSTDILIVAAVSNWGAYGIEAALALLLGRMDFMQTPEVARNIITKCLEAGGLEALFCTQRFFVDGIAGESSVNIVQLLREMVRIGLEEPAKGPAH